MFAIAVCTERQHTVSLINSRKTEMTPPVSLHLAQMIAKRNQMEVVHHSLYISEYVVLK